MTRAASATLRGLLSPPNPVVVTGGVTQPIVAAPAVSNQAGTSAESEPARSSRPLRIIEYVIPDSDAATSTDDDDNDDELSDVEVSASATAVSDRANDPFARLMGKKLVPRVLLFN